LQFWSSILQSLNKLKIKKIQNHNVTCFIRM
jgi:hypothetical protein